MRLFSILTEAQGHSSLAERSLNSWVKNLFSGCHTTSTTAKRQRKNYCAAGKILAIAQSISQVGSWRAEIGDKDIRWSGSEELHKIYGYSLDTDLTMQTWTDRTHPDDLEKTMELWTSALRGDGPGDWEHRIIVNDQEKWLKVEVQFEEKCRRNPLRDMGDMPGHYRIQAKGKECPSCRAGSVHTQRIRCASGFHYKHPLRD